MFFKIGALKHFVNSQENTIKPATLLKRDTKTGVLL